MLGWRGVLTAVLLLAALVSGWSAWLKRGDDAPVAAALQRSDYVLRDFELVTLDAEGLESFSLRAPELRQTPGARTMELATPLFLVPDNRDRRWELRSQTGWINEKSDEIRLRGQVVAESPKDAPTPTAMHTEELDVFPNQNLATSDAAVTITRPGSTMQGIGMRVHLDANRIEQLSKVHIRYEPTSR